MRLVCLCLCFFSSIAFAQINPFRVLSPQVYASEEETPNLLPVASDCLKRPEFRGAAPVLTEINGVYFAYINKCYWEAYKDAVPQSVSGASLVVIANWRPLASLPVNQESQGEICRNKDPIVDVQFSHAFKDPVNYEAMYANYQGCLYYAYCGKKCDVAPYVDTFYPVAEADNEHPESQIVKTEPQPKPPIEPGYKQPRPPSTLKVGEYVQAEPLLDYYNFVFDDYCEYRQSINPNVICYRYTGNTMIESNEVLLKEIMPAFAQNYYCHIRTLNYPDMGSNVCYLNDNRYSTGTTSHECQSFSDDPRCEPQGISPYSAADMKSIRENVDQLTYNSNKALNKLDSIDGHVDMMMSDISTIEGNTYTLKQNSKTTNTELKKLNSTTAEILNVLKNSSTGGGSGGGSGGNYHGDIKKLNDDMNANHDALMETLGYDGDGEPEGGLNGAKEQYTLFMEEYGKGTLQEIEENLDSLFDHLPDLTLQFQLPDAFYGQSGRPVGSCLPIKKQYRFNFTQNMNYDFAFDTSIACDYYDTYFRHIVEFVLYFLTALACFQLYHRYASKG